MMKEQIPCWERMYNAYMDFSVRLLSFRATAVKMVMWKQLKFKQRDFFRKELFSEEQAKLRIFHRIYEREFSLF